MEYLAHFKNYLLQDKTKHSTITVKNYLADVRKFIRWFENRFHGKFVPKLITAELVEEYKQDLNSQTDTETTIPSARSLKRYLSSLRKFYTFLLSEGDVANNPFEIQINREAIQQDPWHLKEFSNYLFLARASKPTIKNYLMDIRQFLQWTYAVTKHVAVNLNSPFDKIDKGLIEEYKKRLLYDAKFSAVSINRKLSSLRKYFSWAITQGYMNQNFSFEQADIASKDIQKEQISSFDSDSLKTLQASLSQGQDEAREPQQYSRFPPTRLLQKLGKGSNRLFDLLVLIPIVGVIVAMKYHFWKLTGSQVFAPIQSLVKSSDGITNINAYASSKAKSEPSALDTFVTQHHQADFNKISNIPKAIYAPLHISTKDFSFFEKLIHHARYTRPKWYKKYHSYAFVHYLHFGAVLIFAIILGLTIYQAWTDSPRHDASVLAAQEHSPPRMLSFEGTLTDATNTPITAEKTLRFGLYENPTASGSALLWQETQNIKPDHNGNFQTMLGKNQTLYQSILSENSKLFLGITIETESELSPRQQIATVSYSQDADKLQGLSPITQTNAGTNNVILALDSGGDLTIGGAASPRFEATGGEFTLAGKTLTLTTTEGSNTNIQIAPDGAGIIDLQKPIQNTTNSINSPDLQGAVLFEDSVGILANTSSQSALLISQNSTGNLISASGSGVAKFTVDYLGNTMLAGDLATNGNNLTTTSPIFNLLNKNVVNLNIGGSATAISIGASAGATMINNSLTVRGISSLDSAVNVKGLLTANGGITIPKDQNLTFSGFNQGAIPFLNGNKQMSQDADNFFWAQDQKRLGLGTNTPDFRLDVRDSSTNSIAQIYNADTSTSADGLQIKLGATDPGTSNNFISFLNGNGDSMGKITGGTQSGSVIFNTSAADYAEYYKKANLSESFEQGDIVCIDVTNGVTKCAPGQTILGVVSHTAGFVGAGNHDNDPRYVLVGIVGQLPAKVAPESQPIVSGDALAVTPQGVIKANKPGVILGHALQNYNPNSDEMVQVALNIGWHNPTVMLTSNGNILPETSDGSNQLGIIETIKVGAIEAREMSANSLSIATEKISIGGQSLKTYIANIFEEKLKAMENQFFSRKLVSPIAEIAQIKTNIISPLSEKAEVALRFDEKSVSIVNPKISSTAAVATIDNEGNASFSGTLRARRIIADEIQGLNIQTATLAATQITNITNIYNSASSAAASIATPSGDIASLSNQTNGTATFTSEFAHFNQGFVALGASSLTDVSINGVLRLGQNMAFSETSINTLGTDLDLQPLRQGNLSIMGGLVKIDTEGNLAVAGNANFAQDVSIGGKLAASLIVPIPNQDLLFRLAENPSTGKQSNFEVQTASGSGILTVNQLGDIIASGTGKFANVATKALTIIRGAQADASLIKTVANASAGSGVITANETERTIVSPFMKQDSLVYITPISDTQDVTPYIARQTKDSFTIQVSQSITKDIKFNWWIVN